jgi:hypothetical protein
MDIVEQTLQPADTEAKQDMPPEKNNSNGVSKLLYLPFLFVVLASSVFAVMNTARLNPFSTKNTATESPAITEQKKEETTQSENAKTDNPSSSPLPQEPLFTGKVKKLSTDLKLFKLEEYDYSNNIDDDIVYYEAGTFSRGDLQGYTRIIAIRPADGPTSPYSFLLATKDYKTYVLNDSEHNTALPDDNWQNPFKYLDKNKISEVKVFDTEHPQDLKLNDSLSLYSNEPPIGYEEVKGSDGPIFKIQLKTDFSAFEKLPSQYSQIAMYFKPAEKRTYSIDGFSDDEKMVEQAREKYIRGDSIVYLVDSAGYAMEYYETTPTYIKTYTEKKKIFDTEYKTYLEKLKEYEDGDRGGEGPAYPESVHFSSFAFSSSEVRKNTDQKLYTAYSVAAPSACAIGGGTKIVTVKDDELTQIGTVQGVLVYALKNPKHELNVFAYKNKMNPYNLGQGFFEEMNKGKKQPTFDEYIQYNPLLFIKDYWNRWVMVGEWDYNLPGGCGKPVLYLYPEKQTEVTVSFDVPVQFTTDIPKYDGYWKVLADPSGYFKDLRQTSETCSKYDVQKIGSEYAKAACEHNNYPYIYWAGNVFSHAYTEPEKGWIVAHSDLDAFLQKTLSEIGFTEREKRDFIEYWLPEMKEKNAPYYKIGFLQTKEMNALVPMNITPAPTSTYRYFMDYKPLVSKPAQLPVAPTLEKIVRRGFTVVEWGGKKY